MKTTDTINGKTPDEIKKGLKCQIGLNCEDYLGCDHCPISSYTSDELYNNMVEQDALAYIQQLESRLAQVERERDAAISELANSCYACRFILDDSHCEDCFQRDGKYPWSPMVRTKFEWRGVCPKNTKEDTKE